MEYTHEQKENFKRQFGLRRKHQIIVAVPVVALVLLMATADERAGLVIGGIPVAIVAPIAIVVVIAGLLFSLKSWRCPACNRYLGKTMNPRFCAKCGVALR